MSVFFTVCLIVMIAAFAVGAIVFSKLNAAMRWVFYVNAFAVITELSAKIAQSFVKSNKLLFSLANPIETLLIVMFFLTVIRQRFVHWFSILAVVYLAVATILNSFFLVQNPIPYLFFIVLKGIVVSVLCMIYFYNLFLSDKNFEQPNINIIIIVTGLLFYYSFSAVYFSILNYQMNHNISLKAILKIRPFLYVIYFTQQCSILVTFARILLKKKVPEYAGHAE